MWTTLIAIGWPAWLGRQSRRQLAEMRQELAEERG
jgi:hypothetical protein